jgi:hypothetical protein
MQIGKGKQGVIIDETDPASGFLGSISPAIDKSQWIMWFDSKGDAVLYTEREDDGSVVGEPIRLKAKGRVRRTTGAPQASITGNMEIGRIKINGEDHLTIKVDKNGGTLKHVWPDGEVSDIEFDQEHSRDVKLVGRTSTIVLRGYYDTPDIEVDPFVTIDTPTGITKKILPRKCAK